MFQMFQILKTGYDHGSFSFSSSLRNDNGSTIIYGIRRSIRCIYS